MYSMVDTERQESMKGEVSMGFSKKVTQTLGPKGEGLRTWKPGMREEGRGKWNFYCMLGMHGICIYIHTKAGTCKHRHICKYTYMYIPAQIHMHTLYIHTCT